jgi:hypothetical protein
VFQATHLPLAFSIEGLIFPFLTPNQPVFDLP